MSVPGLDVSHHNGPVDWPKVAAAGYRFAYVKATEGKSYTDPTHARNVAGARAAGLVVGSYHFARPGAGDPVGQARQLAGHLGGMGAGRLPAVLDLETAEGMTSAQLRGFATAFLTALDRLTGRCSWLYTGQAFYRQHQLDQLRRPLWLARYGPRPAEPWRIWQHTSDGTVPGIGGRVDLNVFQGSPDELAALAGYDPPTPAPKPAPRPPQPQGEPMPPTVSLGDRGFHVRRLQGLLMADQLLPVDPAQLDGIAGRRTMDAVAKMQRGHGLKVGPCDAATWRVALGLKP